jgi:glycosyltransferase involved in cell wall biosynthesis
MGFARLAAIEERVARFDEDDFPGAPRILFVGDASSSHTRAWIDLLSRTDFNIRLFATPNAEATAPAADLPFRIYVGDPGFTLCSERRMPFTPQGARVAEHEIREHSLAGRKPSLIDKVGWAANSMSPWRREAPRDQALAAWFSAILRGWRPDIVHSFGIYPVGLWLYAARHSFAVTNIGRWVLQTRGGSDLQLRRFDRARATEISVVANEADTIITDNLANLTYLAQMGVDPSRLASINPIPGTGGIDVDALARRIEPPSRRRIILWPKAYEVQWSKALPVLEAIRRVWHRLPPCRIVMLAAVQSEIRDWLNTFPAELRSICDVKNFVPRCEALELMREARLMVAPSLVDGRPNCMLEAMAAGAVPIVSPIASICEVVAERQNVFFAHNLAIDEIAKALLIGMTKDALVDAMAQRNLALVREIAERSAIRGRVVEFYRSLAMGRQ